MRLVREWLALGVGLFVGLFLVLSLGYGGVWEQAQALLGHQAAQPISALWTHLGAYVGCFVFAAITSFMIVVTSVGQAIPSREQRAAELAVREEFMREYGISAADGDTTP